MENPSNSKTLITRESGRALIEDANRWQKAYARERNRVVELEEALRKIASCESRVLGDVVDIARRALGDT